MKDTLLEMALGDLRESALFASLVEAAAGLLMMRFFPILGFLQRTTTGGHRLTDIAAARTRIRLGALAAHRQSARVPVAAQGMNVF